MDQLGLIGIESFRDPQEELEIWQKVLGAPVMQHREFPKVECDLLLLLEIHFIPCLGKWITPTWFNFLRTFLLRFLAILSLLIRMTTGLNKSEALSVTDEWAYVLVTLLSSLWHTASFHQRGKTNHGEHEEKNPLYLIWHQMDHPSPCQ